MFSGFYSPYFIVPKKGGGLRRILDLRVLNRHLHKLPFRMVTQKRILTSVRRQDWFMAIDLKDAYFHVSILPRHRPFLWFAFEGRAYQYRVLPFGLSLSPRVFTKVVEAALLPLREEGVRVLNYLDDWLILAHLQDLLCTHRDLVLRHLDRLGLQVNWEKSKLSPAQSISFLGMELDSISMTACLVSVTLPEAFQAASGLPETISEAPGAHGILGGGGPPRVDVHVTAPTLATESSSLESVAHQQQAYGHHAFLPAHPDPLVVYSLPTGGGPPRAGIKTRRGNDGCLPSGLGCCVQRARSVGAVEGPPPALAYQLPRVVGCATCTEEVPTLRTGQARAGPVGQHSCRGVYQPPGWCSFTAANTTRPTPPPVESAGDQLPASHTHPG
ncbi:uncharacterized protein LOC130550118 isoform X1 [Triplophysa rosa]|uniref:uncharacterized protein LOC130550118 isoform X1 n=1 Tax=Triplophysa rosa TaxID=992332 RepID=UPI002545E404|nr:uncharacterized protein LOC130550118 isoform X1 [Triplophysa rosa]